MSVTEPLGHGQSAGSRSAKQWYLVYTKARQEQNARENLERQGYEVYFPKVSVRRRRQGGYRSIVEPMFPRYLFIHLDLRTDDWGPIRSTYGVTTLVYFGHRPAHVGDELVEMLRCREDENGIQQLPTKPLDVGDNVRIIEGVMAGYEGIFVAKTARDRVSLLLHIAGKQTEIDVSMEQLEPAT